MGTVLVLSTAAVTACGKKLEVADEKTMESVDEEIAEIPESAAREITAVYTLSGDVLSVDSGTAYIPFMQGDYYRKKDASCWKTEIDGTDRYLDETESILRNHMTPDVWNRSLSYGTPDRRLFRLWWLNSNYDMRRDSKWERKERPEKRKVCF